MSMMNYTDMVAHVTWALGNRTDVSTYAGRWVNWAYRDIWNTAHAHNKEDISTGVLTSGTSYISIPSGTYSILSMTVDDLPLERDDWREYEKIDTFPSAAPTKYYIFGSRIYFDTEPDSAYAYEMHRIKDLTALSGTLIPDLPDYYEGPLVSRALAYGYRDLQMPQESNNWFSISSQQMLAIKEQYHKEVEDNKQGIRLTPRRRTR